MALDLVAGSESERRGRKALWLFAFWTALALVTTADRIVTLKVYQRSFDPGQVLASNLVNWYLWAIESIFIIRFARRFPLDGPDRWRHLSMHTVGATVAALVMNLTGYPFEQLFEHRSGQTFAGYNATHFGFNFLLYWVTVGVGYAFEYQRKFRDRALRASRLEAALSSTQLQVVRMQLHPHFLFNALNAVSALVHRDPLKAEEMIARLSELLRASIDADPAHEVTVREEFALTTRYLDIMQMRFQERLQVEQEIEPGALGAPVPNFLLQPLVENSIRHAISPRSEGGRIWIRARADVDRLVLTIEDDGPGFPASVLAGAETGLGLSHARTRLEHLYGARGELRLSNRDEGGARVEVTLPLSREASPPDRATERAPGARILELRRGPATP